MEKRVKASNKRRNMNKNTTADLGKHKLSNESMVKQKDRLGRFLNAILRKCLDLIPKSNGEPAKDLFKNRNVT